jgi:hypothetical protein
VKAGAEIARLDALIAPDRTAGKTKELSPGLLKGPKYSVAFLAQGYLAAANFSDRARQLQFKSNRSKGQEIPVFRGHCSLSTGSVTYGLKLGSGEATLRSAILWITSGGTLNITGTETGEVLAENAGRRQAVVAIAGSTETQTVRPGQIVKLA